MFRNKYPTAWNYHYNTSRWTHNLHPVNEAVNTVSPFKEYLDVPVIVLPQPSWPETSLREAIAQRCSCRRFAPIALSLAELSTVLRAAYGTQGHLWLNDQEFLERPVPSAGGLYPLEIYALVQRVADVPSGICHYSPLTHSLELIRDIPLSGPFLSELFLGQPYLAQAAVILVLTAVFERSFWKYEDRGYRYVLLEAGHVAQNINLTATAMGLGSLNLGGFFDDTLGHLLELNQDDEAALYGIGVGTPAETDRAEVRLF